jgi:hypothetical protein
LAACSSDLTAPGNAGRPGELSFDPEQRLGKSEKNPSTPFLRYAPDGWLFAVWTEEDDRPPPQASQAAAHSHESKMKRPPSPMRLALLASSADGGKTWSSPKQINRSIEAIEGEEGGPRVAFGPGNKAYVVWSIPNDRGDKTRAKYSFCDGRRKRRLHTRPDAERSQRHGAFSHY